jgi:hypothetical protein
MLLLTQVAFVAGQYAAAALHQGQLGSVSSYSTNISGNHSLSGMKFALFTAT